MQKRFPIRVRPMKAGDLKSVLEIERFSFQQPYSREIMEQELKISAARLFVAVHHRKVVGYIDFWWVRDEIELVSIASHPRYKRRGIGEHLLHEMLRFAHLHEVKFIYLDVRQSNDAAQALYEKFGFNKVGVRRRYYSDNQEDALIMKKEL